MIATSTRNSRTLWLISLALGGGTIAIAALMLFGTFWGDPVIYLPYARNNAAGDFFAYNPGVFSSGATSPLWSLILSITYLIGAGVAGAKVIAILFTAGAFAVLAIMTARFNGRTAGAGIALLYIIETLTLVGLMMYESPLIVIAVAMSVIAGDRLMMKWTRPDASATRELIMLVLAWSVLPLARPEAALLVPLQLLSLWLARSPRSARTLGTLLVASVVAAIPSVAYYGYSYARLGAFSVSSKGRAFALLESADRIGPIVLSRDALGYVGSILFFVVVAVAGLDLLRRNDRTKWIAYYGAASIALYVVLLVFVQPVTNDLPRYFLPIAPFIVLGAGHALARAELRIASAPRAWALSLALMAFVFVMRPPLVALGEAYDQSRRGYSFDQIVERDVVERVNALAQPGDKVLAYEVQARYYLRPDVSLLSLDGITDGLVAPYLASADMASFLKQQRPSYWIANNAGAYRPYLRRSVLQRAISSLGHPGDSSNGNGINYSEAGITFELLARRTSPMPRGFAGWTMLVRISYDQPQR